MHSPCDHGERQIPMPWQPATFKKQVCARLYPVGERARQLRRRLRHSVGQRIYREHFYGKRIARRTQRLVELPSRRQP